MEALRKENRELKQKVLQKEKEQEQNEKEWKQKLASLSG